jgi:hypothetical protein
MGKKGGGKFRLSLVFAVLQLRSRINIDRKPLKSPSGVTNIKMLICNEFGCEETIGSKFSTVMLSADTCPLQNLFRFSFQLTSTLRIAHINPENIKEQFPLRIISP